ALRAGILLLLPQQLRDAQSQLRVLRLPRELVDQGVDRLERIALLLVEVGDVVPGGRVQGVALGGPLVGGELAVDAHMLRLVHRRDADMRSREVRLDGQGLAGRVERPRELALGTLLVALARLLAGPDDRVETLRDQLA